MGFLEFTKQWREETVQHDRGRIDMLLKEMTEHVDRLDDVIPLLPDAVQDELLSADFAEYAMAYFDDIDKDGSGSLEPGELVPVFIDLAKAHPFALTEEQCRKFVAIFDTERTGVISRNEFLNAVRFMMIMGYLETEQGKTVQDVADITQGDRKVEQLLNMLERDRETIHKIIPMLPDAVYDEITCDEFIEACHDRFDELDKDKNGVLEPSEVYPLIIELSEAHPYSVDTAQCERFTAVFDIRGDGVIRIDEFLDFARFLTVMSYLDSDQAKQEFSDGLQIFEDTKRIEDLIVMLERDRQEIRKVIPYLPNDLRDELLSEKFTLDCINNFKELDKDNSGSLEPHELFPIITEMIDAHEFAFGLEQMERFTAIFDDEKTGYISQKEFVNLARFMMVMSFLKTKDGQKIVDLALEAEEQAQEDPQACTAVQVASQPSSPQKFSAPSSPQAGHLQVDLEYYQQKAEKLRDENSEQRQRMIEMEEKMRRMEERMDLQDNKLRHATIDLNGTK
jgi:Ca2+-binding EF-hand superfamily protein